MKAPKSLCVSVSLWPGRSAKRIGIGIVAALALAGCSKEAGPDAYGNVEATEVVVSAQSGGQLTKFAAEEGQKLDAGAVVGAVDSSELALQRDQAAAQRAAKGSSTYFKLAVDRLMELVAAESLREDAASFGWRPWARAQARLWAVSMQVAQEGSALTARGWRLISSAARQQQQQLG